MLILVRILFFLGLVISLICFYLYMTGRGEHYKMLGRRTVLSTLVLTIGFFLIAIAQRVFLNA